MAISYNTGTTGSANTASSVAITIPSGVLVNDVMIMSLTVFTETSSAPTVSFSGAGGTWTKVTMTTGSNPETATNSSSIWSYSYAYYRVATSGDPGASLTITESGSAAGTTWFAVALASYTGASTSSPVDVAFGSSSFNATSATAPSGTTNTANDWALYLISGGYSSSGLTMAGPGTIRQNINSSAGIGATADDSNGSAGAAGTTIGGGTWSLSGSAPSNDFWGMFTIGLAPASAGQAADVPQAAPGPAWFNLFKPWMQRPRPPAAEPAGPAAFIPNLNDQQFLPGPTWLDLFKPGVPRPRQVTPPPGPPAVNVTGSFILAPLALSAQAGETSPDQPQVQPGPAWLDLFKPWVWRPRPPAPQPGWPAVTSSGSLSLAPLAFAGSGGQSAPDLPQVTPGPSWLRLFRPWVSKPRPFAPEAGQPGVTSSGSFTLAPLALSGTGAQSSPDITQATPGPAWLRLFRPWVQRPVPPPPSAQSVNATGSFSLAPLAFSATAAQSSPDLPQPQPGPSWLRLFRPQAPKPLPPLPAFQAVSASGSLTLAPLAFSGTGTQTSPDLPQITPGPVWLRLLRPQVRRPLPPPAAAQNVTSSGSFTLAPLAFSGSSAPPLQDLPQVVPGPSWLRFFRPWVQRPVPPAPPAWLPPPATSSGSFTLAPLAFTAQGGQSSPDIPQTDPGPFWLRLFRPWIRRPFPPVAVTPAVTSSGSFSLAPLALSGQGGQSASDLPSVQPGLSWLRFFRSWQPKPRPPAPATPAVSASGSFSLAPVTLSGTGTATGGGPADQVQVQPGLWWLRLFKPGLRRPAPFIPSAPPPAPPSGPGVRIQAGEPYVSWAAGSAYTGWVSGEPYVSWNAGSPYS